jgi:hypothetical protein
LLFQKELQSHQEQLLLHLASVVLSDISDELETGKICFNMEIEWPVKRILFPKELHNFVKYCKVLEVEPLGIVSRESMSGKYRL